ncbi:response regulator [Halorarum salinum]|nr:response regulator [Halobaculum salinum]
MTGSPQLTVLAVDDDPDFVALTAQALEREDPNFKVQTVTNAIDAFEQFADNDIDCIVSDYEMPEMSGLALLEDIRMLDEHVPFILFTGRGSEEVASDAISAGVTDYLQKQSGTDQYTLLANRIRNSAAQHRAKHERQLTIDRMTDALLEVDDSWQVTTVDSRAEAIYDVDADEMLNRNLWEIFPEAIDTSFYDTYHKVMETREPLVLKDYCDVLELWFEVNVYPAPDGGISAYIQDATKRMPSPSHDYHRIRG